MSLFEKLNNKRYNLQEAIDDKGNITPEPGDKSIEKSIVRNIKKKQIKLNKNEKKNIKSNTKEGDKLLQDINKRKSADLTRADAINRSMGSSGSTEGTAGAGGTITKTKTVKQSEISKQAKDFTKEVNKKNKNLKRTGGFENVTGEGQVKPPKTRAELIAKRKEYGIDSKGNISDAGVKRYAQKTKELSSGSNLPVTPTKKELEIAKKRAVGGSQIKNKGGKVIGTTTGKYGGKLTPLSKKPRSLAKVQAKIDAKNPTYKSPITGGKLPLKDPDLKRMSSFDRAKFKKIKDTTPKGGIPKWMKDFDKQYPDKSKIGPINEPPKLPRTVLTKTKVSKAFPLGLKPVDTKTKEGEKIARKVTKKFVTDKELMTGFPPETKPPKSPKSPKPSLFTRAKKALKGFHKFMVKDAGFRKTSGDNRLKRDVLGQIARDKNMTRNIFKNTMRGNTLRKINKFLPGKYKALAALATGTYLATRPKKGTGAGGKGDIKRYRAVEFPMGFDSKSSSAKKIYDPKNPNKYK
tara:strand:- start:55 stop:1611 length:1557 start_codon:yes stop_codon:yes gene_type:complete